MIRDIFSVQFELDAVDKLYKVLLYGVDILDPARGALEASAARFGKLKRKFELASCDRESALNLHPTVFYEVFRDEVLGCVSEVTELVELPTLAKTRVYVLLAEIQYLHLLLS